MTTVTDGHHSPTSRSPIQFNYRRRRIRSTDRQSFRPAIRVTNSVNHNHQKRDNIPWKTNERFGTQKRGMRSMLTIRGKISDSSAFTDLYFGLEG
jgi:hypothetical protein